MQIIKPENVFETISERRNARNLTIAQAGGEQDIVRSKNRLVFLTNQASQAKKRLEQNYAQASKVEKVRLDNEDRMKALYKAQDDRQKQ